MSGQLAVFAGSLAGIALLVLISLALGLGRGARIADEAEAHELADNAICGFEASEVTLDAAGRGALLRNAAGSVLLLKPHGALFAAQLLDGSAHATREGTSLTVAGATLDLGDAAGAWEKHFERLDS
jgi:hypothetical protein